MGKIFAEIDRAIINPRVRSAYSEGFSKTQEDIQSFYSQGNPIRYTRTGLYGMSPDSYPPPGANGTGNYHYSIWLDIPGYMTGSFSGQQVLEEAQHNGSGILGKPGTWEEAQEDIKQAIEKNFS